MHERPFGAFPEIRRGGQAEEAGEKTSVDAHGQNQGERKSSALSSHPEALNLGQKARTGTRRSPG